MLTKPRTDLPYVGAKIVVLHGGEQFYVGPMDVVDVDPARLIVTAHPDHWEPKHFIEWRPSREDPEPLRWNLLSDLTEAEQAEISDVNTKTAEKRRAMLDRIGPELRVNLSQLGPVSGGTYE